MLLKQLMEINNSRQATNNVIGVMVQFAPDDFPHITGPNPINWKQVMELTPYTDDPRELYSMYKRANVHTGTQVVDEVLSDVKENSESGYYLTWARENATALNNLKTFMFDLAVQYYGDGAGGLILLKGVHSLDDFIRHLQQQ